MQVILFNLFILKIMKKKKMFNLNSDCSIIIREKNEERDPHTVYGMHKHIWHISEKIEEMLAIKLVN